MAAKNFKCYHLTPLHFKGLTAISSAIMFVLRHLAKVAQMHKLPDITCKQVQLQITLARGTRTHA